MSLNRTPQTVTAAQYQEIFDLERGKVYPSIDHLERQIGFAVNRAGLEAAARILCCPFKASPPNWQHGRVIYAVARAYLKSAAAGTEHFNLLDIGTAKGFSALCLLWATEGINGAAPAVVTSVDVLPPDARVRRNTPAEVEGLRTLREILEPFPESKLIAFLESTGVDYLKRHKDRIHVAFVDGKHTDDAVWQEGQLLAARQVAGDVVIFDDWQVPGVAAAIKRLAPLYALEVLQAKPGRAYVIGRRK